MAPLLCGQTTESILLGFVLVYPNRAVEGYLSLVLMHQVYRAWLQVQKDIGFKHIRGHGLLDDDMSTYLRANGAAGTNLLNLFSVFGEAELDIDNA